jgi:YesN/AraC family two-component response regulator
MMIKEFVSFVLLFLILSGCVFSQNNSEDITLAEDYIKVAIELKDISLDSSIGNLNKAEIIAAKHNNYHLLAKIYYSKAKALDSYQLYDSSLVFYAKAAPYYIQISDPVSAAKCYINIGATEYYYGHYEAALKTYKIASKCLEGSNRLDLLSKVHNNLALIYKSQGKYVEAIEKFQIVLELHKKGNNDIGVANVYLNIGTLYWEHNNLHNALSSFNKALDIYVLQNMPSDEANVINNIGLVYSDLDSLALSLEYFDKALELFEIEDDKIGIGTSILNKAVVLDKLNLKEESETLFLEALALFDQTNYPLGTFICKLNLSRFYSEREQHSLATQTILEAFELQNVDIPIRYMSDGYLLLAENYSAINEYRDANTYFRKYFNLQDSIFNIEVNNQLAELQSKYEYEKAEAQLAMSEQTVKIQTLELENKEKRIRNTTIILLLSVIFTVIFIVLYIQKRKTYLDLVKQNVAIAKFDIEKEEQVFSKTRTQESVNANPVLSDNQKDQYIEKLLILMDKEKFFMQKQITISHIAKELKTNRNYISQLINDCFNTNFNSFINEYRVREARKLLVKVEFDNYTIEGIGETVGFHSKATFNSAFKKITGVTPSFFKQNSHKI